MTNDEPLVALFEADYTAKNHKQESELAFQLLVDWADLNSRMLSDAFAALGYRITPEKVRTNLTQLRRQFRVHCQVKREEPDIALEGAYHRQLWTVHRKDNDHVVVFFETGVHWFGSKCELYASNMTVRHPEGARGL